MVWQSGHKLQKGRYTIKRELGQGRFAVTYLAEKKDGTNWVIKTLKDDILNHHNKKEITRLQDKLWQEANALAACQHPHIVKANKPFRERTKKMWGELSQVCIPMEFIQGKTLQEFHLPLSEQEALKYIEQIGKALMTVHETGCLHRDIKPSNIMIREGTNEAVLIDFGLVKEFDEPLTTVQPTVSNGFAPPELYDSDNNVERGNYTDIYSLAATLYFLLTNTTPPESIERHRIPLISPQNINPQISGHVNQAILKGMEIEPNRRPQNVKSWLEALLNKEITGDEPSPPIDPQVKLQWIAIWVTLIVGILTAIATLVAPLIPNGNNPPTNPTETEN